MTPGAAGMMRHTISNSPGATAEASVARCPDYGLMGAPGHCSTEAGRYGVTSA